jgi:hypothetical protein
MRENLHHNKFALLRERRSFYKVKKHERKLDVVKKQGLARIFSLCSDKTGLWPDFQRGGGGPTAPGGGLTPPDPP